MPNVLQFDRLPLWGCTVVASLLLMGVLSVRGQDVVPTTPEAVETTFPTPGETLPPESAPALPPLGEAQDKVAEIAEQVDQDPRAQEVSAGILQPIYRLAEKMAFPAFHWVAFAVMATGVVSFALQIVLGKLAVLLRGSISFKEILSDVLGLVISATGLVLTTQAAAENSTFTQSPAAVLSASAVGAIAGFVFYLWGQRQELEAVRGRKIE
ncbi:MAG: hypothetical protein ACK5Q5_06985 [Planctomycetaceae bacterium]